jgi:DNA alkylation damage repair protein AlkB
MQPGLPPPSPVSPDAGRLDLAPGVVLLSQILGLDEQKSIAARSLEILNGPAGGYVPVVRGGGRMRVRMACLGRHWNPLTYRYEATRSDFDQAPVGPVPPEWVSLAAGLSREAGFACSPDICLINEYGGDGRMGLHQDKDESAESIASGAPVVSISIGDTARFLLGGLRRRDPVEALMLRSGDVLIFGGPARLRYHGVSRILSATAPAALEMSGRLNLTFRQY